LQDLCSDEKIETISIDIK